MGWCTHVLRSYCGPLVTIAVGVGFMLVGAVPVAVTYAVGPPSSSATIIGVGFVGFGLLVVLPGVAWCFVRRLSAFRCCRCSRHRLPRPDDDSVIADEEGPVVTSTGIQRHLPALSGRESSTTRCYILTDEQYLCSDKSAIFFEPTASERVTSTGSSDDVELDMEDAAGGSQRGDGYIQLTR